MLADAADAAAAAAADKRTARCTAPRPPTTKAAPTVIPSLADLPRPPRKQQANERPNQGCFGAKKINAPAPPRPNSMALLAGKNALVTGSTQGIGYSILRALALAGCDQGRLWARCRERTFGSAAPPRPTTTPLTPHPPAPPKKH
jgi:hypothetical protein